MWWLDKLDSSPWSSIWVRHSTWGSRYGVSHWSGRFSRKASFLTDFLQKRQRLSLDHLDFVWYSFVSVVIPGCFTRQRYGTMPNCWRIYFMGRSWGVWTPETLGGGLPYTQPPQTSTRSVSGSSVRYVSKLIFGPAYCSSSPVCRTLLSLTSFANLLPNMH